MDSAVAETRREAGHPWKAALASGVGSMLEFYDFFIYSPMAALVFAKIFFPASAPGTGTLLSLATFAVGFVARPIGGLISGHFGDRVGRRPMLVASFLFTGAVTFAVGLLPTYGQIGIWAPVLLVTLRFLQGVGLGGEWGGAALLAVEHAPPGRKAFFGSIVSASAPVGVILANGVVALLTATLTEDQMLAWGWRLPFLVSVVLVFVGLVLRLKVEESPDFTRAKETGRATETSRAAETSRAEETSRAAETGRAAEGQQAVRTPGPDPKRGRTPVLEAITRYPKQILSVIGIHIGPTTVGFLSGAFLVGYAEAVMGISASVALAGNIVGSVVNLLLTPLAGRLADRFGQRDLLLAGGAAVALWGLPMVWLLNSDSVAALFCVFIGGSVTQALLSAPEPAYFASLFPAEVRYSGMSIGYQAATILGGGAGPLIAQALVNGAGGSVQPVGFQVLASGLLVMAAVLLVRPRADVRQAASRTSCHQ
ncbi:MFS transporter [Streptomyces sp. NPDC050315]|uniref:MFS transporter n=1 Tax=Streptomyces sp. NPDC050315 TaxID=3155039 RepID=UPI00341BE7B3